MTTSVKEFDLVFQYYETSYERWILPRGPVICEKVADTRTPGLTYDIVLTMALQLPPKAAQPSVAVVDTESPSSQVVTIRLKRPPPAIWETIWKWVGGEEKLNENRKILDGLKVKKKPRLHRPISLMYMLETNGQGIFGSSNSRELTLNTTPKR
jgi:hypothetical protein